MALDRWLTKEEREKAAANGISAKTLYYRLYLSDKWSVEEALTAPPGTVRHSPKGEFANWIKLAEENGISKEGFYSRLKVGMGCKEAATKPLKKNKGLMKLWLEIAKPNKISYQTFMTRIHRKWDIEKAATTPVKRTGKNCSTIVKEKEL